MPIQNLTDEIEITEDHEYCGGGYIYPSVTTIIDDCGAMGKKRFYTEESRIKGKQRHSMFADYLLGTIKYENVSTEGYILLGRLQAFLGQEVKKILIVEKPMIHTAYGFAGTPDFVYESKEDDIVLCDWKNQVHTDWHRTQASIYGILVRVNDKLPVKRIGVVYTNLVNWKITYVEDREYQEKLFLAMLMVYESKHGKPRTTGGTR